MNWFSEEHVTSIHVKNVELSADIHVGHKYAARSAELTKLCNITYDEKFLKNL